MANPISKSPTPTLASGQSTVLLSSAAFSPTVQDSSPVIVVDREPVKIAAFGLTGDSRLTVLQVADVGSSEISEEYRPNGEEIALTSERNEVVLHRSGRYRLAASDIEGPVKAFWWPFSMTHEWYDEIAEALRFLCTCVSPQDVQIVAGPGITIQNLGSGSWRVSNAGLFGVFESPTVAHEITDGVLNSHVKLSEDPGNELFARDDGLYAAISDPNAPCNLGALVQPASAPVSQLKFVVLDSNNCLRWVRARSFANYMCEFDCEETPPPSNCCNLQFTHSVIGSGPYGLGDTITLRITATGSNLAACRAFTNGVSVANILGTVNGWRFLDSVFSGVNPFTNTDFFTSNVTSWTLDLIFSAEACNPSGRVLSMTLDGNCRNAFGQTIEGSGVVYPINVTLPAITEDCAVVLPPPPGGCCGLNIAVTTSFPAAPVSVGQTATIEVVSVARADSACHGRLFVVDTAALNALVAGTGWVVDSLSSTAPGQTLSTGINHNAAGLTSITSTINLKANSCDPGATRTLTVQGACFNSFVNQLPDSFVDGSAPVVFPAVTLNCDGEPPPPADCGINVQFVLTPPTAPVIVGSTFTLAVTVFGSNNVNNRTRTFPLGSPAVPAGWAISSVTDTVPVLDTTATEIDFFVNNITQFTTTYTFLATALTESSVSVDWLVRALCVNNLGVPIANSTREFPTNLTFPAVTGVVGNPNCCNFQSTQATPQYSAFPIPVGGQVTLVGTITSNTPTQACRLRLDPIPAPVFNIAGRFTLQSVSFARGDGSPLPPGVNPGVGGVDFWTANINSLRVTVIMQASSCNPEPPELIDVDLTVTGGCVDASGQYISNSKTPQQIAFNWSILQAAC
jgi:hypothetical protein